LNYQGVRYDQVIQIIDSIDFNGGCHNGLRGRSGGLAPWLLRARCGGRTGTGRGGAALE
jgi:hypothetical protein